MTSKAETLNQAIVNKVDSILKNTDHIDSIYITIEGNRGEVPTITYKIKELIFPEDCGADMKGGTE